MGGYLSIARGWCVTKQSGALVLGVMYGSDAVSFNAHRVYGSIRYPYLTQNWCKNTEAEEHKKCYVFEKIQI